MKSSTGGTWPGNQLRIQSAPLIKYRATAFVIAPPYFLEVFEDAAI
jgi:hypothetical protein